MFAITVLDYTGDAGRLFQPGEWQHENDVGNCCIWAGEEENITGSLGYKRKHFRDWVVCVHGILWVFDPASLEMKDFLLASDARADAHFTEVMLPEHTEEPAESTRVTLQAFALLCKISKWMSAWRQKTSFDSKAAPLSSEEVKLSDEMSAFGWSQPTEGPST